MCPSPFYYNNQAISCGKWHCDSCGKYRRSCTQQKIASLVPGGADFLALTFTLGKVKSHKDSWNVLPHLQYVLRRLEAKSKDYAGYKCSRVSVIHVHPKTGIPHLHVALWCPEGTRACVWARLQALWAQRESKYPVAGSWRLESPGDAMGWVRYIVCKPSFKGDLKPGLRRVSIQMEVPATKPVLIVCKKPKIQRLWVSEKPRIKPNYIYLIVRVAARSP